MDNTAIITRYVVEEFVPDIGVDELPADYDLFANGVIDSLALLKLIQWLGDRFGVDLDDVEMTPDQFRTVRAIDAFVAQTSPARSTR